MQCWNNKVAVISDCGDEVGFAIMERLAKVGMIVVGFNKNEDILAKVTEKLKPVVANKISGKIVLCKCNILDTKQLKAALDKIYDTYEGVDVLINNAHCDMDCIVNTGDPQEFKEIVDLNVNALVACTRRSEAYDDPLRIALKSHDKFVVSHKLDKSVSLEENQIQWSNLIFLQFHPVFKLFILYAVLIKAVLGPLQSVYPIVYCNDVMDYNPVLIFFKYCYLYIVDTLYGIDTFLHIVHRQVTDKAMRRQHMPKSAVLLICDLLSLIPFFRLVVMEPCPPTKLWPNILSFNEFLVIYRVTSYFDLVSTHSIWKILVGYTIVMIMSLNCITCFWLLLTEEGFCDRCLDQNVHYDWRGFVWHRLNDTNQEYTTYMYAFSFVFSFTTITFFDDVTKPSANLEFMMVCMFTIFCYLLNHFIITPKCFAESIMRLRMVCDKYVIVHKIIAETERRNIDPMASKKVEEFYKLLWTKRSGITNMPEIFNTGIPRYLRIEIEQDILWPLFYHSPSLRKTSFALRRCLSEHTVLTYRLPGEKFFTGAHSTSSLYYLKSGVVQLISADDGTTPILSVTSGTLFGDINFYIPNAKRKVSVRCLTYCEVYLLYRKHILLGLHKYAKDRQSVMAAVFSRIDHAKRLFACKKLIRGNDRSEDEGIAWIKRRWWEIWDFLEKCKLQSGQSKEQLRCALPQEETPYHCAKYIGQLVLCTQTELQTDSMFTRFKFPCILNPISEFGEVWRKIVIITVMLVVCLYPPNLIKPQIPPWFIFFTFCSDSVYLMDLVVSLFTAIKKQETVTNTFAAVMFKRFKSFNFILDILSTVWIEDLADIVGAPHLYFTLQFNRLIKIHKLFYGNYLNWNIRSDPLVDVCRKLVLINVIYEILCSHIVFELTNYIPSITVKYFFGDKYCSKKIIDNCTPTHPAVGVTATWAFEWSLSTDPAETLTDIYVGIIIAFTTYLLASFSKSYLVSLIYLKNREQINYQRFVRCLKKYYEHYRIHQDLVSRLDRYLICHWKYYKGRDVMYSNSLNDEPAEIYWKAQGEVALRIIGESQPFKHADPALVREMACAASFLVIPKNANVHMFGIQCKMVSWVVQGFIKSEFHDKDGENLITYYGAGSPLALLDILFHKVPLSSYTSYTDCEILYILTQDFFDIFKRHHIEYEFLQNCVKEYKQTYQTLFEKCILKHRDYHQKLRDTIYTSKMSTASSSRLILSFRDKRALPFEGDFWGEPESAFMQSWLMFRAIIVYLSISSAALLGGVGVVSRWTFTMISAFCDCIAWIDIVIKLFLAYYDDRGILITDKWKCFLNYLTKAFILDVIGAIPLYDILKAYLTSTIDDDVYLLINTMCKFAHLYILFAYFDYISDRPTVNSTYINIIKWQLVTVLIVLGSSHYFMLRCVQIDFDKRNMALHSVHLREGCWMPDVLPLTYNLTWNDFHLIFAESLNLAEGGTMGFNFGRFMIDRNFVGVSICLFMLALVFWLISGYSLTMLVLDARGDYLFQYSVNQLRRFLHSERVDKRVIRKTMAHFRYSWKRTKGMDVQQLTNTRIGVVFRQDLNYYFYKRTFTILDSLLKGGEPIQRQLASACSQDFFLPGHDIIREMDIMRYLCIVHRGKVDITKGDQNLIVLTKGDIFGQLEGTMLRPIRVTAVARDTVDLLYIDIKAFQEIINDDVRKTIAHNPQHVHDFLATKHVSIENPYDTVEYLLRGKKTIRFPWSEQSTEARNASWYSYFLCVTWFIGPFASAILVNLFAVLPSDLRYRVYIIIIIFDVVHLVNFLADFYTTELVVLRGKCVHQRVGCKKFKQWGLYLDLLSFIMPLGTLVNNDWRYQLARMYRIKYFYDFHMHFCRSFKSNLTPIIVKIAIVLLVVHVFTCGWVYFACRPESKFPIDIHDMRDMKDIIDFSQWMHPDDRGEGCARTTRGVPKGNDQNAKIPTFIVPRYWANDYLVALTYILLIHTHTNIDIVIPVSLTQVYYKIFVTFVMKLIDIYIIARAINAAYAMYRDLYQYDYTVKKLLVYLTHSGLCKYLSHAVLSYTKQLWDRQKGERLPELAYQAPTCLRQDIFTALYIHHLDAPPIFRQLPDYFKKQLAARLQRMVVFPGNCIVREGDTFNVTYFIHEGEVEKWHNDVTGESTRVAVLYTNSFFGCMTGLFKNVSFKFSYYSRTVVDLVFLKLENWKDLLDCYPEVKAQLYESGSSHRIHGLG